jgi:hypothetical protein
LKRTASRDFADIKVYVFMFQDLAKVKSFVAPWRRVIVRRGLSAVTKAGIPINNNTAKEILPCIDMPGGTLSLASKDSLEASQMHQLLKPSNSI